MRGLPLSRIALAAVRGRSGAPYCPPADFYVLALQSCLLIQRITAGRGGVWAMVCPARPFLPRACSVAISGRSGAPCCLPTVFPVVWPACIQRIDVGVSGVSEGRRVGPFIRLSLLRQLCPARRYCFSPVRGCAVPAYVLPVALPLVLAGVALLALASPCFCWDRV